MSSQKNSKSNFEFSAEDLALLSQVFFTEAEQILKEIDQILLKLDIEPTDQNLINNLFRKVHTIKGGLAPIPGGNLAGSLSHSFEALLEKCRKESNLVDKLAINLFFQGSNLLKVLIERLQKHSEISEEDKLEVEILIQKLNEFELKASDQVIANMTGFNKSSVSAQIAKEKYVEEFEGAWVSQVQIQDIIRVSSELVVLKNLYEVMQQSDQSNTSKEIRERRQTEFIQSFNKLTDLLQIKVAEIQKVKISDAMSGLIVLVRQLSGQLNKEVNFISDGFDLQMDRNLSKDLNNALIHAIRNSLDHGIESVEERIEFGKQSTGQIKLSFLEKNGVFYIELSDDGRGLSKEKILKKAIEKNLINEVQANQMSENEIYHLIFEPGFSTSEKVTSISGRGVGMDVLKTTVEEYGGKLNISSEINHGMKIFFEIPVPKNIIVEETLICTWSGLQFAIPLVSIARICSTKELKINEVDKLRYCQLEGNTIPLLSYSELKSMCISSDENSKFDQQTAVFIRAANKTIGLIVDIVNGQSDLVIRNFDNLIKSLPGFKGTSVLADEKITYIVDPLQLVDLFAERRDLSNLHEEHVA